MRKILARFTWVSETELKLTMPTPCVENGCLILKSSRNGLNPKFHKFSGYVGQVSIRFSLLAAADKVISWDW